MNVLKIDLEKKFDGAETTREQHSKLNNSKKLFNFPVSPRNKNIKSINLGNIDARPVSKYSSKGNSTDKAIIENIKKMKKPNSTNNLNNSNHNINNNNIQRKKEIKNLELIEKDITNFKDFKNFNQPNNDLLFRKGVLNNKIKSILFPNNNLNNHNNNLLLKAKQNIFNNFDNSNIKLVSGGEVNKIDLSSILDLKNKPLIVKLDPKRSTGGLKGKKINEKIKNMNKNNKVISSKFIDDEEIKRIKTPTKKLFIESDRDKVKESLSEYIHLDKNFIELKNNTTTKIKNIKNVKVKLVPEENHFKAVIYSQEIKKLNKNLE